jgi:predicted membrane protein
MNEDLDKEKQIDVYGGQEGRRIKSRHHILTGLFIVTIGAVLLMHQSGVEFPFWFFTWPVLLIAIGILGGIKTSFRPGGWLIVLAIGGIFLADRLMPGTSIKNFAGPMLIIAVGIWMIVKPKTYNRGFGGRWRERRRQRWGDDRFMLSNTKEQGDSNDFLDTTSIFGGVKKVILSKNFKGGDITNIMGGTEINLTQADIPGRITIDTTNFFGGTKIIIPPTWDIQSDIVAIFGGVDDKRQMISQNPDPSKVIHLSGICIFGGIEIRSF